MEVAFSQQKDATTYDEIQEAGESIRFATRLLEFGVILLAFIVAGISIEYNPNHRKGSP